MKKHILYVAKGLVFAALALAALAAINAMSVPKYLNSDFPTSTNFLGFYEMEENTVDVLFLGSSHTMSAFSPQELYDRFGIRSYNLGSQEQNLLLSYYWLREALRFQRPQVVVLDTYLCFEFMADEPLNSSEVTIRRALDHMRWSGVKWEAVCDICARDQAQSVSSYIFPNIRYHDRWLSDLKEADFTPWDWPAFYQLKGYALVTDYPSTADYQPFQPDSSGESTPMLPVMEEYLGKIADLCREEGIRLLLVKTPTTAADAGKYNAIAAFARARGLDYYDFNEASLYEQLDYDFASDNREWSHVNHWGAVKLCGYLGGILTEDCGVAPVQDRQWEDSRPFYEDMVENAELQRTTDLTAYLEALRRERYTVFLVAKDDASASLTPAMLRGLADLGLETDLAGRLHSSFYAVVSPEGVREELGEQALAASGSFRGGLSVYSVSSAGFHCGNACSIVIDGQEYAKNRRGLNIVVYDSSCKKVVDSVCFDTFDAGCGASR